MFEPGYVYVLSNECFNSDDIFKIGYTTRDPATRVKELSNTSVFADFHIVLCKKVDNCKKVENILHTLLNKYRINNGKEFFKVNFNIVKVIFDSLEGDFVDYNERNNEKKITVFDEWTLGHMFKKIGDIVNIKHKIEDRFVKDFTYDFSTGQIWKFKNKLYIKKEKRIIPSIHNRHNSFEVYELHQSDGNLLDYNKLIGTYYKIDDVIDYEDEDDNEEEDDQEHEIEVEVQVDEVITG